MDYTTKHLFDWLSSHPAIKISVIEKLSDVPVNTIDHFLKKRRKLPKNHYDKICSVLYDYGFKTLDHE